MNFNRFPSRTMPYLASFHTSSSKFSTFRPSAFTFLGLWHCKISARVSLSLNRFALKSHRKKSHEHLPWMRIPRTMCFRLKVISPIIDRFKQTTYKEKHHVLNPGLNTRVSGPQVFVQDCDNHNSPHAM